MKYIIFGSAWYVEDWFDKNYLIINENHYESICLVAINNAAKVVTKHRKLHLWYQSTDFLMIKYYNDRTFDIHEYFNYYKFGHSTVITGDFLFSPYKYDNSNSGTMILNVCYDLLNKCIVRNEKINIGVIGSDLIYNTSKTHFYNGGNNDPLRFGQQYLEENLSKLNTDFKSSGNTIYNLSEELHSLLPFEKISLNSFIGK